MQLMQKRARIGGSTLRARSRREKADVAADVAAHVLPALVAGAPAGPGVRDLPARRGAGAPTTASPPAPSSARWSSSPSVIEAVLFDGDQTLWDFERVMRDALDGDRRRAARRPARAVRRRAALAGPAGRPRRRGRGAARRVVAGRAAGARLRPHAGSAGARPRVGTRPPTTRWRGSWATRISPTGTATPRSSPTRSRASTPCVPTTGSACCPTGAGCPRRSGWPPTSSRWCSRRTTGWPSPTRGSSRWSSASSASGPRRACSSATIRSTTWPARTARAGVRCGSTATARCPSPTTVRGPTPSWPRSPSCPTCCRRLRRLTPAASARVV